ncbi:MAG: hypothetical protein Kow0069_05670 [Promethearchaeota archaeon]
MLGALERLGSFPNKDRLVKFLVRLFLHFSPVFVAVFGSIPRGEAHAGSDIDVLVVAEDFPESFGERYDQLNRFFVPGVDFRPLTRAEFQGMAERWDLTVLEVCHAHWFLYDPRGVGETVFREFERLRSGGKLVRGDFWWVVNA